MIEVTLPENTNGRIVITDVLGKELMQFNLTQENNQLEIEGNQLGYGIFFYSLFIDEELVKKARRMAVVYTAICAFENTIREFISKKLYEEKGEKWWDSCVKNEVKQRAENRKNSENESRWLTQRGKSMIYYTDFGDLISIMAKKENWGFFEPHIINIDWAQQIITTLEKSRHIIMHGGELSPRDVERVGTYIRDWISQVGG